MGVTPPTPAGPSNSDPILSALLHRHSVYAINDKSPISDARLKEVVHTIIQSVPSSFNNQTTRLVVLLRDDHKEFWELVKEALRPHAKNEEGRQRTDAKIDGFKAGFGTILCLEDPEPVTKLQQAFPQYAHHFPDWSEQTSGMHQVALWTSLEAEGFGANLQHYNPLIDENAKNRWNIPAEWRIRAQLVFGGVQEGVAWPQAKEKLDTEETVKWHGLQ